MTVYHKNIRQKWQALSFFEKMANVGSEVLRAVSWQQKGNAAYAAMSFERALELLDYTTEAMKDFYRLRELRRLREALVDYFAGSNSYCSSAKLWENYFYGFNYATAISRQK